MSVKKISFPFLYRDWVSEEYDTDEMFDESNTEIYDAAQERILSGLQLDQKMKNSLEEYDTDAFVLSYPLARIMISEIDNEFLAYLFVLSESRRSVYYAQNSPKFTVDEVCDDLQLDLSKNHDIGRFGGFKNEDQKTIRLFWEFAQRISEGLLDPVPTEISENVNDSVMTEISRKLPQQFSITSRGIMLGYDFTPEDVITHFPPYVKQICHKIQNNVLISEEQRDLVITLLLDCGITPREIADWFNWESTSTDSYGLNYIFDLQGEYRLESSPFHTQTTDYYIKNNVCTILSEPARISHSPLTYVVVNIENLLTPKNFNVR